jgi:hypothetical protein
MKSFTEYLEEGHWNPKAGDWVEVDTTDSPFNGDYGQIEKVSGTNHAIVKFADGTKHVFRVGDLAVSRKAV